MQKFSAVEHKAFVAKGKVRDSENNLEKAKEVYDKKEKGLEDLENELKYK